MSKRMLMIPALLVLAVMVVGGCSKAPVEQQNTTVAALDGAKQANAELYAPQSWLEAQEAMKQAQAELETQNGKFSLLRSYGTADELLAQAQQLADKAKADAVAAKETMRQETQAAFEAVRTQLMSTQELLATAPRGKDTKAEIESMQQELAGLTTTLETAGELIRGEHFQRARAQIDQVGTQVSAMRTDLEAAIAKVQTRK
ncbi:MAG: hypothetical protein ABIK96_08350 [bacterium]|nr:hypothetical protein [bacterium]